jgi:hypothetical protein
MRPDLRVLDGSGPGPVRRRPRDRTSADQLPTASSRLRTLQRLLVATGRIAEGVAAGHIADLVDAAADDGAGRRVGLAR